MFAHFWKLWNALLSLQPKPCNITETTLNKTNVFIFWGCGTHTLFLYIWYSVVWNLTTMILRICSYFNTQLFYVFTILSVLEKFMICILKFIDIKEVGLGTYLRFRKTFIVIWIILASLCGFSLFWCLFFPYWSLICFQTCSYYFLYLHVGNI